MRPDGQTNENLETGEIEVICDELTILNESKTPPFEIDQDKHVGEEHRLTYRYLDLRRARMQHNIILRHQINQQIRNYMSERSFQRRSELPSSAKRRRAMPSVSQGSGPPR